MNKNIMDTFMDKDIQFKKYELSPTNSNPKIYHGQLDKVWKDLCVLGHSQIFEQFYPNFELC